MLSSFSSNSLLTATYLLPAVFLNPVLCLHGFNLVLSTLLGPLVSAGPLQAPPTRILVGSTPVYPYVDVHASDNLCWSYTACMVVAQLVAYSKIRLSRERRNDLREAAAAQAKKRASSLEAPSYHQQAPNKSPVVIGAFPLSSSTTSLSSPPQSPPPHEIDLLGHILAGSTESLKV